MDILCQSKTWAATKQTEHFKPDAFHAKIAATGRPALRTFPPALSLFFFFR